MLRSRTRPVVIALVFACGMCSCGSASNDTAGVSISPATISSSEPLTSSTSAPTATYQGASSPPEASQTLTLPAETGYTPIDIGKVESTDFTGGASDGAALERQADGTVVRVVVLAARTTQTADVAFEMVGTASPAWDTRMDGQASMPNGGAVHIAIDGSPDSTPEVAKLLGPILTEAARSKDPVHAVEEDLRKSGQWTLLGDIGLARAAMASVQSARYQSGDSFIGAVVYWPSRAQRDVALIGLNSMSDDIVRISGQEAIVHQGGVGAGGTSVTILASSGHILSVVGDSVSSPVELLKLGSQMQVIPVGQLSVANHA